VNKHSLPQVLESLKYPCLKYSKDMGGAKPSKSIYFEKLKGLLDEYKSIFLVGVDNVSSQQVSLARPLNVREQVLTVT
jgi:hypothetical protein